MNKQYLEKANLILNGWLKGFNTNNWNEYIQLLSDNYLCQVSPGFDVKNRSVLSTVELSEDLKKQGIQEITTSPVRVTSTDGIVAFEFKEPLSADKFSPHISFAFVFDYVKGVISTYPQDFSNRS